MEAAMKSFAKFSKRFFPAFLFMVTLFLFACGGGGGGGGGGGDDPGEESFVGINETSFMYNGEIITLETDPYRRNSSDIKIFKYNPVNKTRVYLNSSNGPINRNSFSQVLFNDKIIIFGGVSYNDDGSVDAYYNDIWQYDIPSQTWTELESENGPEARSGSFAVIYNDKMIVYGGSAFIDNDDNTDFYDLWQYNIEDQTWEELQSTDDPLQSPDLPYNDIHYFSIINGSNMIAIHSYSIWSYSLTTNNWQQLKRVTSPQAHTYSSYMYDGIRYIYYVAIDSVDGDSYSPESEHQLWRYDVINNALVKMAYPDITNLFHPRLIYAGSGQAYFGGGFNYIDGSLEPDYNTYTIKLSSLAVLGAPFSPGTGSFSIPTGTYSLSGASYVFKGGNLLDMTAGGSTVSDISYSYNTSNGALTFGYDLDSDGTNDMSYTYNNCFTVESGGTTYLFMPGFKKTSGDAASIIGTYEFSMSTDVMGTVTNTSSTITYNSNGTYTVTTSVTGQPNQTQSGTWDTNANTVTGYNFVTINGGLYMYVPQAGYVKQ